MIKRLLLILLAAGILGSTAACGKLRRETAIPETTETYITDPVKGQRKGFPPRRKLPLHRIHRMLMWI